MKTYTYIVMQHLTISLLVITDLLPKGREVAKGCKCEPYNRYPVHSLLTFASAEYDLLRYYSSRRTLEFLVTMAIPAIGNGRPTTSARELKGAVSRGRN